jgi:hypothetical protein
MALLRFAGVVLTLLWPACLLADPPPAAAIGWGSWSRASSQPLAVSGTLHPAIARITVQERDGIAFGSGSLVDVQGDQGLVITNWHVVRDASGDIEVAFPNGFKSKAKVIKLDKDWDLAALVIWKPNVDPIPLSSSAPQPGEILTIAGYGSGNFRAASARCTQYVSPGHSLPYEMVEVGTEARQGDSGGPILNQRGEIAGVLFGAGGGTTSGSYVGRVRTFLSTVTPTTPRDGSLSPPPAIVSTNPFVNAQGTPHLVAEANARIASPAATSASNETSSGWHVAKAEADATASVERMVPIPQSPSAEANRSRAASRTSQVTFGSIPDPLAASDAAEDAQPDDRELLPVWSRPLPKPPAVAPAADALPPSANAAQAITLNADLLGKNPFEQGKTVLAGLGLIAVAMRLFRTRPAPATE